MLKPGDRLPDLTLPGEGDAQVRLHDRVGQRALVIYFYPKDDTPGCTVEACSFRDSHEAFVQAGAEVIGISADDARSHEKFKAKHRLPFTLLSDPTGAAAAAFGVKRSFLGLLPGRVTFVVDTQGVVQHAFDSQLRASAHVTEALGVVERLSKQPQAASAR
jgi:peroxiredoxin Q/BCP